jgi:hypothetical protein
MKLAIYLSAFLALMALALFPPTTGVVSAQNPQPCASVQNTAVAGQVLSATTNSRTPVCRWSTAGAGGGTVTSVATKGPISGGTITTTGTISCPTCTVKVAAGTKALATGAISSATCTAAQTATATGTLTTDVIQASFNGDPTGVTGYVPLTAGMLTIIVYPTADTFNAKVCNNTTGSITPGAITLNWRVDR